MIFYYPYGRGTWGVFFLRGFLARTWGLGNLDVGPGSDGATGTWDLGILGEGIPE